jgi:hypothetical protein
VASSPPITITFNPVFIVASSFELRRSDRRNSAVPVLRSL